MKALEQLIGTIARFAVGLGIVFALVSAYVIVDTDPGLGPTRAVRAAEVIRLDPVTVTISARRFAEIRAELDGDPKLARKPEPKKDQG